MLMERAPLFILYYVILFFIFIFFSAFAGARSDKMTMESDGATEFGSVGFVVLFIDLRSFWDFLGIGKGEKRLRNSGFVDIMQILVTQIR